ncbi:MAG: formylglycine-generating enzyme family protein [Magnetococcus sp. DMHC-1]|nr:formylglycine-generating enzyme family protein [Magnetococcales bacterium]
MVRFRFMPPFFMPLLLLILLLPMTAAAFLINEWEAINIGATGRLPAEQITPGEAWLEPVSGIEFTWIASGCYKMGSHPETEGREVDEGPVHEACLDGFWISRREITQGQWRQIMRNNPAHFRKGDDYPVEQVAWDDIEGFVEKLNQIYTNRILFRLPSEAEWEYTCRNRGQNVRYSGGGDPDRVAWYQDNSNQNTQRTGSREPNRLGIWDMSGNVWEWTRDSYQKDAYAHHPRNNPKVENATPYRVIRGGGWQGNANTLRCTNRGFELFSTKRSDVGLRLVSVIRPPETKPPVGINKMVF